jgi:hypothetical protein
MRRMVRSNGNWQGTANLLRGPKVSKVQWSSSSAAMGQVLRWRLQQQFQLSTIRCYNSMIGVQIMGSSGIAWKWSHINPFSCLTRVMSNEPGAPSHTNSSRDDYPDGQQNSSFVSIWLFFLLFLPTSLNKAFQHSAMANQWNWSPCLRQCWTICC